MSSGDQIAAGSWLVATVIAAALALVDQTSALQARHATEVGVVIYVMPVVVPVLLAPLLLDEGLGSSTGETVALALGLATVSAGAAAIARGGRVPVV